MQTSLPICSLIYVADQVKGTHVMHTKAFLKKGPLQ